MITRTKSLWLVGSAVGALMCSGYWVGFYRASRAPNIEIYLCEGTGRHVSSGKQFDHCAATPLKVHSVDECKRLLLSAQWAIAAAQSLSAVSPVLSLTCVRSDHVDSRTYVDPGISS